jgi:hypothetical protein
MSDNTKLKKAVRARIQRTGESYVTARMHVLRELAQHRQAPASSIVTTPSEPPATAAPSQPPAVSLRPEAMPPDLAPASVQRETPELQVWSGFVPDGGGLLLFTVYRGRAYLELWLLSDRLQHRRHRWSLRRMLRDEWPFLLKEAGCLAMPDSERRVVKALRPPVAIATSDDERALLITRKGLLRLLAHVDHPYAEVLQKHLPAAIRGLNRSIREAAAEVVLDPPDRIDDEGSDSDEDFPGRGGPDFSYMYRRPPRNLTAAEQQFVEERRRWMAVRHGMAAVAAKLDNGRGGAAQLAALARARLSATPGDLRLVRLVDACDELESVSRLWDAQRHTLRDPLVLRGEKALRMAQAALELL